MVPTKGGGGATLNTRPSVYVWWITIAQVFCRIPFFSSLVGEKCEN